MGAGVIGVRTDERHISGSTTAVIVRYVERVVGIAAVTDLMERAGDGRSLSEVVDVAGWTSYSQACALLEAARHVTADADCGFRIGEEMLRQHAGTEVAALLRSLGSPEELLRNVAASGSKYSTVTQLEAVEVGPTTATITARASSGFDRHPLFCDYTAGFLSQAPALFGMDAATVEEVECQRQGAQMCRYVLRWDPSTSVAGDPVRQVAHLEAQLVALTERFEALQATAGELVSATDVETLLAGVARRAGLAVRAPGYVLAVRLPGEESLRVHDEGIEASELDRIVGEISSDPPGPARSGRLVVDVASAHHHYGRLAALYPSGSEFFTHERRLLVAYAAQAAAALDTATALREVTRRNETARDLLRLSTELADVASGDDVAPRIAAAVPSVIDCDYANVYLWDPSTRLLRMRGSVGLPESAEKVFRALAIAPADTPVIQRILDERTPHFLNPSMDDPFLRALLELAASEATVIVPIAAREEFFGVVTAGVHAGPERLHADGHVVERLQGLAAQAAVALQNARLLDEVSHRSLHDPLSGLPNRTLLRDRLTHALLQARRSAQHVGVIYVDLDGFKQINDAHGHATGDKVIVRVAERIRAALRPGDTVARVGGDEFVIVLPDMADDSRCGIVASKVLAEVRRPMLVESRVFEVTASVGAVAGVGCDSYDTLLQRADVAMYDAKRAGRNTHVIAPASGAQHHQPPGAPAHP